MNGTDAVRLAPLLPVSALSLTWIDIALPGLLIALALLLHTVAYPQEPSSSDRAHIYRATTSHARYLPREAAGRFRYPVLYLGFDLHALESGGLDLGRLFSFRGRKRRRRWAVLTVNPRNYLGAVEPRERIYSRLVDLVAGHAVPREAMASAYTVAMPGLLAFEDINPLTTHFCYGAARQLIAVVLEVSNTFGEKHAYVLRVGVDEDAKPGRGCVGVRS